jgi:DNA-binding NtrC family response regulator
MATQRRSPTRVLLVDPDSAVRRALARVLLAAGFDVATAEDARSAEALAASSSPEVVVSELGIANELGAHKLGAGEPAFVVLAEPSALERGLGQLEPRVASALVRGVEVPGLVLAVKRAGELSELRRTGAREGQARAPAIVAASRSMRVVMRALADAAASDAPLLLLGEPGTGRGTLARWVHAESARSSGPFVVVPLGTPDEASLAELLADDGLAAQTRGGTLVLADLDRLPRSLEPRVLSLVQRRDPRFIATATPELRARRERGELSNELYFRLAAHLVDVPPLRARADDLPVLARMVARRESERLGLPDRSFGLEALRALRRAPLPGNLPELEARIVRALGLPSSSAITSRCLGLSTGGEPPSAPVDLPYVEARARALLAFEQSYVRAMLAHAGGNVSLAARASGMDRANFRRILRRLSATDGDQTASRPERGGQS